MGRVYLGYSAAGRWVAVKVIHPHLAGDPNFVRRFRHEVEAAGKVSGAYTAPVVASGPNDNPPWLATQFVGGPSLESLIYRTGPLPEAAVWKLAGGLVEALQAIHQRGLIHRDLKPGNILMAVDGPKVIDFGISRSLEATRLTGRGLPPGTPAFMSPEQVTGSAMGPASDVFSLGSVIAFAATGIVPFDGDHEAMVTYRVTNVEPDLSRVPPALLGVVSACLYKDPWRRPALDQLLGAISVALAAFPGTKEGNFWPGPVPALLESFATGSGPAGPDVPEGGQPGTGPSGGRRTGPQHAAGSVTGPNEFHDPTLSRAQPRAYVSSPPGIPQDPRVTSPPGPPWGPQVLPGPQVTRQHHHRTALRGWLVGIGSLGVIAAAIGVTLALVLAPRPPASNVNTGQSSPSQSTTARPSVGPSSASTGKSSAAPATATPSSSASLPATSVFVCGVPGKCAGFTGNAWMSVEPSDMDVSAGISGLNQWSGWGTQRATSSGTINLTAGCTVTLTGLVRYTNDNGRQVYAYSTITVHNQADNQTLSFTAGNVP
jgi:serine/threonine protein kinase